MENIDVRSLPLLDRLEILQTTSDIAEFFFMSILNSFHSFSYLANNLSSI